MSKKHDVAEYYKKIVKKYPENIRIDLQTITYENLLNNSDFFKDRYFVVIFHLLFSAMP